MTLTAITVPSGQWNTGVSQWEWMRFGLIKELSALHHVITDTNLSRENAKVLCTSFAS
jgi:hypothetical protein